LSSVTAARRRHSDGNLTGPVRTVAFGDRDGGNDLSICCPFSSNQNHLALSQPLALEPDPQLDTRTHRREDVPQLGWTTLSHSKANSSLSNFSEQQWFQFPGRQCFRSLLKSDRLDATAS